VTCDRCGVELHIGDFPFCPHGAAVNSVIGDDILGGFVQEHFGHEPEVFYSKQAMARRAKELNLTPMVRYSGPHDRHVTRWDVPSQYTLDAAAAMIARMK
jgi:hypothetical protein